MATTIATLTTKADGSMEGVFATLRVNAPITVVPNANKASEEAPDYRIINAHRLRDRRRLESHRRQSGEEYLSVKLEAPEIGVIFGNLAPAPGGDEARRSSSGTTRSEPSVAGPARGRLPLLPEDAR